MSYPLDLRNPFLNSDYALSGTSSKSSRVELLDSKSWLARGQDFSANSLTTNRLLDSDFALTESRLRYYKPVDEARKSLKHETEAEKAKDVDKAAEEVKLMHVSSWIDNSVAGMAEIAPELEYHVELPSATQKREYPSFLDAPITDRQSTRSSELKLELVKKISTSMVDPGVFKRGGDRDSLFELIDLVADRDPEFIFKVAVYCRRELNIRTATNFLVAKACSTNNCYPFVDKYFSACIRIPSDWIEVAELFKALHNDKDKLTFPHPLRRNMITKFAEFDNYQLAKHNMEKGRTVRFVRFKKHCDVGAKAVLSVCPLTLKYLIRTLHISSPRFAVMCILGKHYPTHAMDFVRLGLEGDWDPSLAGKRMRLPIPLTWETELSKKGNKGETWNELIECGRLPYFAMLRNLRNILKAGISCTAEDTVLRRLQDPRLIIRSNLFPFRFFSAYAVLDDLQKKANFQGFLHRLAARPAKTTVAKTKAERNRKKLQELAKKMTLKRPYACQLALIAKLKKALNVAVDTSIRYNVPLIRGSTLIICSLGGCSSDTRKLQAAGLGHDQQAIGLLLGMMGASVCETCSIYVTVDDKNFIRLEDYLIEAREDYRNTQRQSPNVLDRAAAVYALIKKGSKKTEEDKKPIPVNDVVNSFYSSRRLFDTVFLVGQMVPAIAEYVTNCRTHLGRMNAVWSDVSGVGKWPEDSGDKNDWVIFKGPTDQVLRYIAESSDKGLLEHVERMDELFGLDKTVRFSVPSRIRSAQDTSKPEIKRPLTEWRCCRVFISSTFRDMHAERDIICGLLLPSLREYATRELHVHLTEIDLRWGVPEEATQSSQALQMCLEQAAHSDLFILLVGNRYGWRPKSSLINSLPKRILKDLERFYSAGMSVTEMEYNMAKLAAKRRISSYEKRFGTMSEQESIKQRIFAFIRDPESLKAVPPQYMADFTETSPEKCEKLNAFKTLLKNDGVVLLDKYPAWFNGLIGSRAVMGNLGQLSNELTSCLLGALNRLYKPSDVRPLKERSLELPIEPVSRSAFLQIYVEPVACAIAPRQLLLVERYMSDLKNRGRQCHSLRMLAEEKQQTSLQRKRATAAVSRLKSTGCDGGILLVTGSPGCGKTTHLAALMMSLDRPHWSPSQMNEDEFDIADPRAKLLARPPEAALAGQRPQFPKCSILAHFSDGLAATGLPPKTRLISMLDHWINQLMADLDLAAKSSVHLARVMVQIKESLIEDASGDAEVTQERLLKSRFNLFNRMLRLVDVSLGSYYVFIVDAVDRLNPNVLDWLPEVIPERINFVLSCDSKSTAARELSGRPDCLALTVGGLTVAERSAAIRSLLGRYGKVLSETGFSSQMSVLVRKQSCEIPLYLRLACDDLRLYGTYKELDAQLKRLPDTIPTLVKHIVDQVSLECGSELTLAALAFLICARRPLSTAELHELLDAWLESKQHDDVSPWALLDKDFHQTTDLVGLKNCEIQMYSLLHETKTQQSAQTAHGAHLPSLAYQILLAGLRPLLAGTDELDRTTEDSDERSELLNEILTNVSGVWLRLRSQEIIDVVRNLCFTQSDSISAVDRLGYRPPVSFSSSTSATGKRLRLGLSGGAKLGAKTIDAKQIFWLLATKLDEVEYKVYYFFQSGHLNVVCSLLTSPVFLVSRFRSGHGISLLEDYQGYATLDPETNLEWLKRSKSDPNFSCVREMKAFVGLHCHTLAKYPFLFAELAINHESSSWVQQIGCAHLTLTIELAEASAGENRIRLFIRRNLPRIQTSGDASESPMVIQPVSVHKFHSGSGNSSDSPTALALSQDGSLLAFGTQTGIVTVTELSTMREIRSFYGHNCAILSLCFISDDSSTLRGSQFWLASTSKDGSVYLWNLSSNNATVEQTPRTAAGSRLASLTGPHHRAVTCCDWLPERRIFATGSLDRRVILWHLPRTAEDFIDPASQTHGSGTRLPPYNVLKSGYSPVNCVAFRPTLFLEAGHGDSCEHPNVIAAGHWDGIVRVFDLDTLETVFCLAASISPISSISFLPKTGSRLAIQDTQGYCSVWNSDNGVVLAGIEFADAAKLPCPKKSLKTPIYQRGQVCYSLPMGQYLIQSGGSGNFSGQINVWNSELGGYLSTRYMPPAWRSDRPSDERITAFASDPSGHVIVAGSSDGQFAVICGETGNIVYRFSDAAKDRSTVQTIACVRRPAEMYENLLFIVGFASGAVRSFACHVENNKEFGVKGGVPHCHLTISFKNTAWHHSVGHQDGGVGQAGGTLCVAAGDDMVASGGGNAECWLDIFEDSTEVDGRMKKKCTLCIPGIGSAVTALAIRKHKLAIGCKNGNVRLYNIKPGREEFNLIIEFPRVARDWITALTFIKKDFLCIGSNDHTVYCYHIKHASVESCKDVYPGPGGAITSLSANDDILAAVSAEGKLKLWRFGYVQFTHLSTHDLMLPSAECRPGTALGRVLNLQVLTTQQVQSGAHKSPCEPTAKGSIGLAAMDVEENSAEPEAEVAKDEDEARTSSKNPECSPSESNKPEAEMTKDEQVASTSDSESDSETETKFSSDHDLFSEELYIPEQSDDEHMTQAEEVEEHPDDVDETSRPQKSLNPTECWPALFYLNHTDSNTSKKIRHTSSLKILIGQEVYSDLRNASALDDICFRIFAPMKFERRALLQGHPGIVATGLAAGGLSSDNSDSTLISVAEQPGTQLSSVSSDIRRWKLPSSKEFAQAPIQHMGPITCISRFTSDSGVNWCVTGSKDGSVILWHPTGCRQISQQTQLSSMNDDLGPVNWAPAIRVVCSSSDPVLPITEVLVFTTNSGTSESSDRQYCVCIAFGEQVLMFSLTEKQFSDPRAWNELIHGESNESSSVVDVKLHSTVLEICPLWNSLESQQQCCDVVASLADGTFVLIPFSSHPDSASLRKFGSKSFAPAAPMLRGRWSYSLHPIINGCVGLHTNVPCCIKHDGSDLEIGKLFAASDIHITDRIIFLEPVGLTGPNGLPDMFFLVSVVRGWYKMKLVDQYGRAISELQIISEPGSITAACCLSGPTMSTSTSDGLLFLIATSDGVLRLFRYGSEAGQPASQSLCKLRQVGIYPTGEEITKVQLLMQDPLQIAVGSQSGSMTVYVIT
ncbi:unnamed protein product [Calicophoron daubneyi]|uniref:TROVE domain-containing protein n=1 Tax=Calicophoron daubneyi TaxID=300641 RepID=A0AAV2TJC2_CALDB